MVKNVVNYLKDVRAELKKVDWPTKKDVIENTWAIVVLSLAIGGFIALVDYIIASGLEKLVNL